MKSERRHELQHNALADWLFKTAVVVRPYQNVILSVIACILVVWLGYIVWSRQSASQAAAAWDEFNMVMNGGASPAKLAKLNEEHLDTNIGYVSAIVLADSRLSKGCADLFENKFSAKQELQKAIEAYDYVRKQTSLPSLQERAVFGTARAREALGDSDNIDKAEKLYSEVVETWPNGAYAAAAAVRLADLKRPATKAMYDRFAKFDPKPAVSGPSGDSSSTIDLEDISGDPPNDPLKVKPDAAMEEKAEEPAENKSEKTK